MTNFLKTLYRNSYYGQMLNNKQMLNNFIFHLFSVLKRRFKVLEDAKLELKYRVEKISKIKRVEDELFLLMFSTRSLTNL